MIHYDPSERGHKYGTCHTCGYHGWSDDSGMCPRCTPGEAQGCPECGTATDNGEYCGDCLSLRASYYFPDDQGGQG